MANLKQQFSDNLLTTSQSWKLIPVDLLIDIFSRVPGESIARFRCVSKFWACILRRPDFSELFLTKSLNHPRILFTIKADGKLFFYSSPQPQNPDDRNSSLVATSYYTSFPNYFPSDICKTVCGLCLLEGYSRKVRVICNPATGESLTLPKVLLKERILPKVKAKSNSMKIAGMYVGYDPIGKQFKVLCMTSSRNERPNTHQVLTLESGKRLWRPVQHKFHFVENYRISGEICINGVLYFGAELGRSSMIVCFNVGSEKFSFINTNDEDMGIGYTYVLFSLTLFNYKGRLGIHHKNDIYQNNRLVLWVLEDAENHKWSKHIYEFSLWDKEIDGFNRRFVGMTGTGEIVWWLYDEPSNYFYLLLYNLEGNIITSVKILGLEEFKHHRYITFHTFLDYVENMKFMLKQNGSASILDKPPAGLQKLQPNKTLPQPSCQSAPSPTVKSSLGQQRSQTALQQDKTRGAIRDKTKTLSRQLCTETFTTPNPFAALGSLDSS